MPRLTTERLALFGTLLATFGELHPLCDHWVQGSKTAMRKRLYGKDLVHADGSPATPDSTRPTMTSSALGRRAVACHVASYTAVQLGASVALTRAFGYRVTRQDHRLPGRQPFQRRSGLRAWRSFGRAGGAATARGRGVRAAPRLARRAPGREWIRPRCSRC